MGNLERVTPFFVSELIVYCLFGSLLANRVFLHDVYTKYHVALTDVNVQETQK